MKKNIKRNLSKGLSLGIISIGALSLGLILNEKFNSDSVESYVSYSDEPTTDSVTKTSKSKIISAKDERNFHDIKNQKNVFEYVEIGAQQVVYLINLKPENSIDSENEIIKQYDESNMIFNSKTGFKPLFENTDVNVENKERFYNPTTIIDYEYYSSNDLSAIEGYNYGAILLDSVVEGEDIPWVITFSTYGSSLSIDAFDFNSLFNELKSTNLTSKEYQDIEEFSQEFDVKNANMSYIVDYNSEGSKYQDIVFYDENNFLVVNKNNSLNFLVSTNLSSKIENMNFIFDKKNSDHKGELIIDTEDYIEEIPFINNQDGTPKQKIGDYSIVFNTNIEGADLANGTNISYIGKWNSRQEKNQFYQWTWIDNAIKLEDEAFLIENHISSNVLQKINGNIFYIDEQIFFSFDSIMKSRLEQFLDIDIDVQEGVYKYDNNNVWEKQDFVFFDKNGEPTEQPIFINSFSCFKGKYIVSNVYYDEETNSNYSKLEIVSHSEEDSQNAFRIENSIIKNYEQATSEKFALEKGTDIVDVNALNYKFRLVFYDPGKELDTIVENSLKIKYDDQILFSTDKEETSDAGELNVSLKRGSEILKDKIDGTLPSEFAVLEFSVNPKGKYLFTGEEFNTITYSKLSPINSSTKYSTPSSDAGVLEIPGEQNGKIITSSAYFVTMFAIIILLLIMLSMVIVMASDEKEEHSRYKEEKKKQKREAAKRKI